MDNLFSLVLYYGGHFVNNLHGYEGGVKTVFDKVPGISIEDVGLHMVNSDHDVMLITDLVPGYGEIEVYVEHIMEEPVINSNLEDVDDDYNDHVDEDDDDLYDRYTDMMDDEIPDQNANNRDVDNSDDDSWDSVEDVEQPEVMGAGVLHFDYESEDLHSVGVGLNESESESESDGNNAEVDDNADVDDSAGVNGRRPRVESRRPTFPIFRSVARAKDIRFEIEILFTSTNQFKEAMTEYAIEGGWGIRFVKNDKGAELPTQDTATGTFLY
ncbi:hypothetical protein FCV25MIE_15769 [Fagus crenata]